MELLPSGKCLLLRGKAKTSGKAAETGPKTVFEQS